MTDKIGFVTGNEHKVDIFQEMMEPDFHIEQLEPREEIKEKRTQAVSDVIEDKLAKARQMFTDEDGFLFVTDVGLYIEGLDGKPGALIKRKTKERFDGDFTQWCNVLDESDSRDATVRMVIGAANTESDRFFIEHNLEGRIPEEPQEGGHGFAWDTVFVPEWKAYDKDLGNKSLDQVQPDDKYDVLTKPAVTTFKQKLTEHLEN
ncbi:MAG: non-canonical purine NTP pyrophosphatase [Candidatus Nanohaloarchaea archaeon]|nr:non-canonical purine NTP pyrophosphatase [Candidatus Nanohaloarchaea archaeon]